MSIENDMKVLVKMTRSYIERKYNISGKAGAQGTTFIAAGPSGREYAIKMFKPDKSVNVINREYNLQDKAADKGVAPAVYAKNTNQKYIIMQKMKETIVDYKTRKVGDEQLVLPRSMQAQLYALCVRLDAAKVVQNDGNPLNLMLDDSGRLYIIDYGLAKHIDEKILKKRGPQPNVNLTLWDFQRRLKHYGIRSTLLKDIQDNYMKALKNNGDYTDEKLLAEGNRALNNGGASSSSRGRETSVSKKSSRASSRRQLTRKSSPVLSKRAVDSDMEAALAASLILNNPKRRTRVSRTSKPAARPHFRNHIPKELRVREKKVAKTPSKKKRHQIQRTPTKKRDIRKQLSKLKRGIVVKFVVDNKTKVYEGIFVSYTEGVDLPVEISRKGLTFYLRIDQLRQIGSVKIIRR